MFGFGAYLFSLGAAARPAGVSSPAAFSSVQRRRLMSDHLLVALRGVTLIAKRSSSTRLTRLSIQPKQSASRTKSSYGSDFTPVWALKSLPYEDFVREEIGRAHV